MHLYIELLPIKCLWYSLLALLYDYQFDIAFILVFATIANPEILLNDPNPNFPASFQWLDEKRNRFTVFNFILKCPVFWKTIDIK